jgi:membrane fusion protein (multidrug efflux system)
MGDAARSAIGVYQREFAMPYDDARSPEWHADASQPGDSATVAPRADAPARKERDRDRDRPDHDDAPGREPASPPDGKPDSKSGNAKAGGGKDGGGAAREQKKRRSPVPLIVLGVVIVLAAVGGGYYWYTTRNEETTDDAYTDGRAITIAPQVSGYVVDLEVNDNQFVKKGQVILRIDQSDYIAARDKARGTLEAAEGQLAAARAAVAVGKKNFPARLAAARARLQSAQAALVNAREEARRQHAVPRGATTQQQVDQADANLLQAEANVAEADASVQEAMPVQENIDQITSQGSQIEGQVAQARADLAQAELNIGYTVMRAPQDGWVTKRNVELGNYLTAGASVMSLVSPQVWVTANFKENQLNRMRPGDHVTIAVDAYPGLKLQGHVDSVQLGSGSRFSAFPAENATGNYVKIVQRVPVKIDIDSGLDPNVPLPLGLSVEPVVDLQ